MVHKLKSKYRNSMQHVFLIPNFGMKSLFYIHAATSLASILPQDPRPCCHKPCSVYIPRCAQCVLHIVFISLRLKPRMLMKARVHQVLDAHVLAIMRLSTSISDMNEHRPGVTPNNYSPTCHVYSVGHKDRT